MKFIFSAHSFFVAGASYLLVPFLILVAQINICASGGISVPAW
jgi:hypothetical protein